MEILRVVNNYLKSGKAIFWVYNPSGEHYDFALRNDKIYVKVKGQNGPLLVRIADQTDNPWAPRWITPKEGVFPNLVAKGQEVFQWALACLKYEILVAEGYRFEPHCLHCGTEISFVGARETWECIDTICRGTCIPSYALPTKQDVIYYEAQLNRKSEYLLKGI